ncbi:MAG: hypothetical protein ABIG30_03475, partial [Candidatus Aenigmatarchaeota archaeon]
MEEYFGIGNKAIPIATTLALSLLLSSSEGSKTNYMPVELGKQGNVRTETDTRYVSDYFKTISKGMSDQIATAMNTAQSSGKLLDQLRIVPSINDALLDFRQRSMELAAGPVGELKNAAEAVGKAADNLDAGVKALATTVSDVNKTAKATGRIIDPDYDPNPDVKRVPQDLNRPIRIIRFDGYNNLNSVMEHVPE